MGNLVNLKKTGSGWEFATEAALEDFVWANLPQLFGLTPLKRQYTVKGQFCDILGLDENRQLTVLELKNLEDRYIVQQLTRYYDALGEEKPFAEEVDCDRTIRLIAVTPSFHRDNYTDRKYCHLDIQFLQFQVLVEGEKFYFQLKDVDNDKVWQFEIPYQERESNDNIPPPPKALQKILSKSDIIQQEGILKFRHKILSFDRRMAEIAVAGSIKYGNVAGKNNKFCAELCSDSKGFPVLFLWLPLKSLKSEKIARARIWTDWQGNSLLEGYVSTGIGRTIVTHKKVMTTLREKVNLLNFFLDISPFFSNSTILGYQPAKEASEWAKETRNIVKKIGNYQPVTFEDMELLQARKEIKFKLDVCPYKNIDDLVNLALDKWLLRIS